MNKAFKRIICIICMIMLSVTAVSVPAQAASVVYEFPFNDYSKWYTGVDGSTDGFTYGYLDSPTKFLDYTYENGVAKMFLTDSIGNLRAYQYGSSGGWPSMYYTYDEAVEIDLTSVAFQYEVAAQAYWRLTLLLEKTDESGGTFPIYLDQLDSTIDLDKLPSVPVQEPAINKNSISLLEAIKKNYVTNLSVIGLDKGNTIKLKGIEIMFKCSPPATTWPVNEFRVMRFVKDPSIPAEEPHVSTDEKTDDTVSTGTVSVYVPDDDGKSDDNTSSEDVTSSDVSVQNDSGTNLWIVIAAVAALVVLAGAAVTVVLIKRKKK